MHFKSFFTRLILLLALPSLTSAATQSFDAWAEEFTAQWARTVPQFVTAAQYFTGAEQDSLDRQLAMLGDGGNIVDQATIDLRATLAKRGLAELARFPKAGLNFQQQTSADLIRWALEDNLASARFAPERYVFEQFNGLQLGLLNFLTQVHPVRNPRDVENYLARLALVAPRLDQGMVEARALAAKGTLPPRFIVERTIEQLDIFLKDAPRENAFVASLDERMAAAGAAIVAADRTRFVTAAERIAREQVIPAFARVRSLLTSQLPATTGDAGVWRLARGAAVYQQALASFTTTAMKPDEIHTLGRREVARLEAEMDKILRSLGYAEGDLNERYKKLDAASQPPPNPDPRPALLAGSLRTVRDAEARCATLFDLRPKSPIEVKREPAFSEATAAAHYMDPAPDGSRPGIYWLPLPGPTYEVLSMRSTAYHETVPGHHFQMALQQESTELPRFRKLGVFGFISAYGEGWALYAERLADENGWYDGDPRGRLGYLAMQLFRARRLVVDTGLHAKKWTREQAIDFGFERSEIERYIVWPGQACSYMIGQLRIIELREKAKAKLGGKFSIQQFHNTVLRVGNVPLAVLERVVDSWVAETAPKK